MQLPVYAGWTHIRVMDSGPYRGVVRCATYPPPYGGFQLALCPHPQGHPTAPQAMACATEMLLKWGAFAQQVAV